MKRQLIAVLWAAALAASTCARASASPVAFNITIPLRVGAHPARDARGAADPAARRTERQLRLTRWSLQFADAVVSAIGYHAYARCLSCLAYPGGGPRGGRPLSTADFSGDRPAETDPLIQPFSRGGFAPLAIGAIVYDLIDTRIERAWPVERRMAADLAEIGGHVWGISTWLPELRTIAHSTAIASACGAQWQARNFGAAFSDGCVNAFYRPGAAVPAGSTGAGLMFVCAPAHFKRGTYLFATSNDVVAASGSPCPGANAFP